MTRARLYDVIQRATGQVLPGAEVEVFYPGTTTPISEDIYSQEVGGSAVSQPLEADERGAVEFWVDDADEFDLRVSFPGLLTFTREKIGAWPPLAEIVNRSAAGTISGATLSSPTINTPAIAGGTIDGATLATSRFASGSAGAPGIAFASETTLGIRRSAAGEARFEGGRFKIGEGGWPYDFASPSTYAPVKTPSHFAIVDGTDAVLDGGNSGNVVTPAAGSADPNPVFSISRVTAAATPGSTHDQNGHVNFTAKRVGTGGLDPTNTIVSHDVLVVSAYATSPTNMAPITVRTVQGPEMLRGPALFVTDEATTKANAQKNLSAFGFFSTQQRFSKEFELIGSEVNVGDHSGNDAQPNYNGGLVGQAAWYNASAVLQPSQTGRMAGVSVIGKGTGGATVAFAVVADPTVGGSPTPTANAARFATGLDILPNSIWATGRAIRVQDAVPSLQTANGQSIDWELAAQVSPALAASTLAAPKVVRALWVNTNNDTVVNAAYQRRLYFTQRATSVSGSDGGDVRGYIETDGTWHLATALSGTSGAFTGAVSGQSYAASAGITAGTTIAATGAVSGDRLNVNTTGAGAGDVRASARGIFGGKLHAGSSAGIQTAVGVTEGQQDLATSGGTQTFQLGAILGVGIFCDGQSGDIVEVGFGGAAAAVSGRNIRGTGWVVGTDTGTTFAIWWNGTGYEVKNKSAVNPRRFTFHLWSN